MSDDDDDSLVSVKILPMSKLSHVLYTLKFFNSDTLYMINVMYKTRVRTRFVRWM